MQAHKNITPITGKRFNILIIEKNKAENKIDAMQLLRPTFILYNLTFFPVIGHSLPQFFPGIRQTYR